MFKKSFVFALLLLLAVSFFKAPTAHAFVDKPAQDYATETIYNLQVVSLNDLKYLIKLKVTTGLSEVATVTLSTDWHDGKHSQFYLSTTTNAEGEVYLDMPHTWATSSWPTFRVDVTAKLDGGTQESEQAKYIINASYATTKLTNDKGYADNADIPVGTKVTFTCASSSELYFGLASKYPLSSPAVSQYSGTTGADYILKHTVTLDTPGTYKVECVNAGPESSYSTYNFTVAAPTSPTGNLTATNCTIAAGAKSCTSKLTWTTANPVGVSSITSNTPSAGTTITTGNNGTNYSVTVNSGSRTFYLNNNSQELDRATVTASCDTGLEADVNGLCHTPCQPNYVWNPNTKKCEFVECYGRAS